VAAAVRYTWMFRIAAVVFLLFGASTLWRYGFTDYQPQYRIYGLSIGIVALIIGVFLFPPARAAIGASAAVAAFICICATVAAPIAQGPVILFFAGLAIVFGLYALFALRALGLGATRKTPS
jgi:peptidoglycan/LPS O-acetylase OafA/YrhL